MRLSWTNCTDDGEDAIEDVLDVEDRTLERVLLSLRMDLIQIGTDYHCRPVN